MRKRRQLLSQMLRKGKRRGRCFCWIKSENGTTTRKGNDEKSTQAEEFWSLPKRLPAYKSRKNFFKKILCKKSVWQWTDVLVAVMPGEEEGAVGERRTGRASEHNLWRSERKRICTKSWTQVEPDWVKWLGVWNGNEMQRKKEESSTQTVVKSKKTRSGNASFEWWNHFLNPVQKVKLTRRLMDEVDELSSSKSSLEFQLRSE